MRYPNHTSYLITLTGYDPHYNYNAANEPLMMEFLTTLASLDILRIPS